MARGLCSLEGGWPGQSEAARGQPLTVLVPAALRVEGLSPQDDLLCDDPVAVHIPFLRDAGLAEVLGGGPQVWAVGRKSQS